MTANPAIVIPIYRNHLEWYEKIALQRAQKIFSRYPIIFFAPDHLDVSFALERPGYSVLRFPEQFFESIYGYNALMLNPRFYQAFLSYSHILIYQLDAFAFSDQLERYCAMGYDYIGAPWPFHCGHVPHVLGTDVFLHVGNGGFSLRKVGACLEVLRKHANLVKEWKYAEDTFFSYCGKYCRSAFRVAPVNIAYQFSWDFYPERCARKTNGILPFGCHAWHRRDADFYVKAFAVVECDLLPYRKLMESRDWISKPVQLRAVACQRMLRRLQNHRPIARYLPAGESWEAFVVGKDNLIIAGRLAEEGVPLDRIYCFEAEQFDELLSALKASHPGHALLIRLSDDQLLMELQKYGLECGYEYQSFWQSYVAHSGRTLQRMLTGETE